MLDSGSSKQPVLGSAEHPRAFRPRQKASYQTLKGLVAWRGTFFLTIVQCLVPYYET